MKLEWGAKEGRRGVLILYIDGEEWKEIHTAVFGRQPALNTEYESQSDLEEYFEKAEYRAATLFVLKRLSIKAYLSSELQNKLLEHDVSEATAERVIHECRRLGYLNDDDWLNGFVQRQLSRKLGPMAILMKLRAKGISQEKAEELVGMLDNTDGRKERITQLLTTRYRNRDLSDFKSREKVIAALIRKGFSFTDVKEAMRALS